MGERFSRCQIIDKSPPSKRLQKENNAFRMFEHALDENRARKGVKDQKSQ